MNTQLFAIAMPALLLAWANGTQRHVQGSVAKPVELFAIAVQNIVIKGLFSPIQWVNSQVAHYSG